MVDNKKIGIIAVMLTLAVAAPAFAGCETGHTIQEITKEGKIIKLDDDTVWDVDAADVLTTAVWSAGASVMVCDSVKIMNTDAGETVNVQQMQ